MSDVEIWIRRRAAHAESIQQRHAEFMTKMSRIGPPLGFLGMNEPEVPDCGAELVAIYDVNYPIRGLWLQGSYIYRGERYEYEDRRSFDDDICIGFKTSNRSLDYGTILYDQLPLVVEAYGAYRAQASFGLHGLHYCGGVENTNPVYNRLLADATIDVDGRNNIYTLEPAQYWDAELCRRALGYGPDEVIRRLHGHALRVSKLMDGAYLVLNDDPGLTYAAFVAMNERYKASLGLI